MMTLEQKLKAVIDIIDYGLGEGFAKSHPELIGVVLRLAGRRARLGGGVTRRR